MTIEECREFYAEEVSFSAHVTSPRLITAFARVPREKFLGPGPWQIAKPDYVAMATAGVAQSSYIEIRDPRQLYHDVLIVLDKAGNINNGQPSGLARWLDALDLKPGERAYHLGCGVGYYTAIITEIVGFQGEVLASEVNLDLAARAQQNLAGYPNVTVYAGDGAILDPGPRDAIFVNAGVTHPLPLWLNCLREGGRLVLPLTMSVGPSLGVGIMAKITRHGAAFSAGVITQLGIYSCTSARDPELEPVLRAAASTGALMKIRSVRTDLHDKGDNCLVHRADVCLSSAAAGTIQSPPV